MEHALKLGVQDTVICNLTEEDNDDDHLGAIGWAVAVIAYCEEKFGKRWNQFTRTSNQVARDNER